MPFTSSLEQRRQRIAVIGSGIAGMSAAWLLSKAHEVTIYEKNDRLGGHSNTVNVHTASGTIPVDTGFIVFNDVTYPNLVALFEHLGVESQDSDMSFGVSLDGGRIEYSSVGASAFLAGGRNLLSPRFWSMTLDLLRFYKQAPLDLPGTRADMISLGEYLKRNGYGDPFQRDHILPQAAAIWSASLEEIAHYPACAFVRFFENHGLLKLSGRPKWRTVVSGSRAYVEKLTSAFGDRIRLSAGAIAIRRDADGVVVRDARGGTERFDQVVVATHANDARLMLEDVDAEESALLGAFRYSKNRAILHTDRSLMPRKKSSWASWNYVGDNPNGGCVVSYWMNLLQRLPCKDDIFLTLNPQRMPREDTIKYATEYEHPIFDAPALRAQQRLWQLQGRRRTWFCGAHFGSGFHEDGLQAGLAVAEQLGGVRRPWTVENESGRIFLPTPAPETLAA
ncbi:amine oxidase [alpha proteobacterium U9-1i]|nr:amine oxidase [alpha proteobacterium U9-1i]